MMYSKVDTVDTAKKRKKERNTPINSNANYHREMKQAPIIMDYCLLQFDT